MKMRVCAHECSMCHGTGKALQVPGTAALPKGWRRAEIVFYPGRDNQSEIRMEAQKLCMPCQKDLREALRANGFVGRRG